MKRNVDLTENRIFSGGNFFGALGVSTSPTIKSEYPWIAHLKGITDDLYLKCQKDSIIAIGTKNNRLEIKYLCQMDSLNYCDCCGVRMNLKPWEREIGVCHKCNSYYKKDQNKCLWRKKEVIRNAVIRTA